MAGAAVELVHLAKTYADGTVALRDVSLAIEPGEWIVVVGPSGCGKTTTLRLIAGLERPTMGSIRFDGHDITSVPPWRRDLAMVFQRPALTPTRTVLGNLALGQRTFDLEAARELGALLGLAAALDRYPHQLSGGQQQRVALGRALARRAPAWLFDEPLGQLDMPLRNRLRGELLLLHRRFGATILSVTHDPAEAWALGQRIAVMRDGAVVQVGSPEQLYRRPLDRFVAEFLGRGPMNFPMGSLRCVDGSIQWIAGERRFQLPWRELLKVADVALGIRAENVHVCPMDPSALAVGNAKVISLERHYDGAWVTCDYLGQRFVGAAADVNRITVGGLVEMTMDWTQAFLFDRITGRTLRGPG